MNQGLRIIVGNADKESIRLAAAKVGLTMSAFGRQVLVATARRVHKNPEFFFTSLASNETQKTKDSDATRRPCNSDNSVQCIAITS